MKKLKSFLVGVVLFLVVVAGIAAWLVLPWPFLLGLAVLLGLWMVITRRGRQARSVTGIGVRSEEHTSELQSLMRISYAVFCLNKKNTSHTTSHHHTSAT